MAGHSKWHNIKNRKAAVDAKKAKIFSQLSRQIRSAVKEGKSADPQNNPALRTLLAKAREVNMPNKKIQKAIDTGLGKTSSGNVLKEIVYEAFGPQGLPIIIVAITDNQNRTASEVRLILSKNGGSLGGPGSVMYMYKRDSSGEYKSTIPLKKEDYDLDAVSKLIEELRKNEDIEDIFLPIEIDDK